MTYATATPRHSTSPTPLTARDWSDTATNYRDAAATLWDLLEVREAVRHDAYAARYSTRAYLAWLATCARIRTAA